MLIAVIFNVKYKITFQDKLLIIYIYIYNIYKDLYKHIYKNIYNIYIK